MSHKNKMFYNYMTEQDAWDEYIDHINSNQDFASTYKDTDEDFKEWCQNYDIVLVDTRERANQLEEAQLE